MKNFFKNPLMLEATLVSAILAIIITGVFLGQKGTFKPIEYKDCENKGGVLVKGLKFTVVCIKPEAIIQLSEQSK